MNQELLNLVFSALADPTRRGMLEQLSKGESNITALAEPYDISQPAISKHLRVLEEAGLIEKTRHGRETLIRVNTKPVKQVKTWLDHYAQFWTQQFDAVEEYLQKKKRSKKKPS